MAPSAEPPAAASEIDRLLSLRTSTVRDNAAQRSESDCRSDSVDQRRSNLVYQGRSDLTGEGRSDSTNRGRFPSDPASGVVTAKVDTSPTDAISRTAVAGTGDRAVVEEIGERNTDRLLAGAGSGGSGGAREPAEARRVRAMSAVEAVGALEAEDGYRHEGLSFWQHMVAGSVAGMVEHMAMFPVDTIKTRMQALATTLPSASAAASGAAPALPTAASCAFQSTCTAASSAPAATSAAAAAAQNLTHSPTIRNAVSSILKTEGAAGLYRGIAAMGLGAGPAHAVYFAVYEAAKESLLRDSHSGGSGVGSAAGNGLAEGFGFSMPPAVAHATAGALATVASDAVLTPMDVVKQRLQLRRSPYAGVVDCCRKMLQEEGISSFYRSYRTTLVMNVPFTAVHFATYEACKTGLGKALSAEGVLGKALPGEGLSVEGGVLDEDRLLTHVLAGGAAGALASAVTNPLDVVKTRLQCQGVCGVKRIQSGSVTAALTSIVREEGWGALMRGMRARMLFHTPAAAIVWSTYEASKNLLR